jgi:hypothetical protein
LINPQQLRLLPALTIALSGVCQVAALWFRELDDAAVIDALIGAVYLFIAIGLFGRSRFTLFVGIVVPLIAGAFALANWQQLPEPWLALRLAADAVITLGCTVVLWRVRHDPSV